MTILLLIAAILCFCWGVFALITMRTMASCIVCCWVVVAAIAILKRLT